MRFKEFIIFEQEQYLAQKVGDILTAVQSLRDDAKSMGTRNLTKYAEKIANQVRRILHQHWPREENKHLKVLQKVAVALMRSIEEKDDLEGTVSSAAQELEKLSGKLGIPIHQLGVSDKKSEGPDDEKQGTAPPPDNPEQPDKNQPQAAPPPPATGGLPPAPPPMGNGPPGGQVPLGLSPTNNTT